jgi:hypothetical protein
MESKVVSFVVVQYIFDHIIQETKRNVFAYTTSRVFLLFVRHDSHLVDVVVRKKEQQYFFTTYWMK